MIRADRLGFSRWRVATALGISPLGLASIEKRIELAARREAPEPPRFARLRRHAA